MTTTSAAFGFGKDVSGGGTAAVTTVSNRQKLIDELTKLAVSTAPATVLELDSSKRDAYDFSGMSSAGRSFRISSKNVTIRGKEGKKVRLRNFALVVDVDNADNVLIENLNFRANGDKDSARDAISLDSPGQGEPGGGNPGDPLGPASTATCSVRITRCSFNGYYDIAVDSHTRLDHPRLLATIDHCLFVDSKAGTAPGGSTFVNRGAINIDSAPVLKTATVAASRLPGNARVTIALNVFVDVWRRCPRIAQDTFGHIYNNLLFRWGFGNESEDHWVGIAIGGGDKAPGAVTNGIALVQANRLIPWDKKHETKDALDINANTMVDAGQSTNGKPNRFDRPNGKEKNDASAFGPTGTIVDLTQYASETAMVKASGDINWMSVLNGAVPDGVDTDGLKALKNLLKDQS